MLVSTGATQGAFDIDVSATLNRANVYYDPELNRFYEYVAGNTTWTAALAAAQTKTINGATGYLVTITSKAENDFLSAYVNAPNAWIGASDRTTEGVWRWESGPEAGTQFWQGGSASSGGTTTPPFNYAGWAAVEPNNAGDEDYGVTNVGGVIGQWNDLSNGSGSAGGYIVEYSEPAGGWTGVTTQTSTAFVGSASGGVGGVGGTGGKGGAGALGGAGGGSASTGGSGGNGGTGGIGGTGNVTAGGTGGTGGGGGTGGAGGTSGTGNLGTAGTAGGAGGTGDPSGTGGTGGTAGAGGSGGAV
jgi:hypothetical protein